MNTEGIVFRASHHACIAEDSHNILKVVTIIVTFAFSQVKNFRRVMFRADGLNIPKFRCWSPNL